MSEINVRLTLESADTDSLQTATVMRLIFEGPAGTVEGVADLLIDMLGAKITRATSVSADGTREDITASFNPPQIDLLETGDSPGAV